MGSISAIIEMLEAQKKVHEELIRLSHEKRNAIARSDIPGLGEIVASEQKLIARIRLAEKRRATAVSEYAESVNEPDRLLTLAELCGMCEGEERQSLHRLHRELEALIMEQIEINAMNKELLETQLEYAETMMNIMVGAQDPLNNLYDGVGNAGAEGKKPSGIFDRKI